MSRSVGNLRFTGRWILTSVFATQADILTSALSTVRLSPQLLPNTERSPTGSWVSPQLPHSFGRPLESPTFSAQGCSTSELLRTL